FTNSSSLHFCEFKAVGANNMELLYLALTIPEQRRLRVVLGKFLRFPADFVICNRLRKRPKPFHPCLERTSTGKRVRLIRHATTRYGLAVKTVALVIMHFGHRCINWDFMKVWAAEPG